MCWYYEWKKEIWLSIFFYLKLLFCTNSLGTKKRFQYDFLCLFVNNIHLAENCNDEMDFCKKKVRRFYWLLFNGWFIWNVASHVSMWHVWHYVEISATRQEAMFIRRRCLQMIDIHLFSTQMAWSVSYWCLNI